MSDADGTAPRSDDEAEPVLGEHEPREPAGGTPVAPVGSAPALQRRDAGGETS